MNQTYSVIIPHFNSAEMLPRMLDSIPRREDIQIIVVDDMSTDGSFGRGKKLSRFNHVHFINPGSKLYAGGARNHGLALAQGQYVLFADSDDYFAKGAFELFDHEIVTGKDLILFKSCSFIEGTDRPGDRDNYRNIRLLLEPRAAALGAVGPIAKLVKRSLITDHGLYFSEVIAANDIAFSVKAACLAETIVVVQQVVYCISQGGESLTASVSLEKSLSRLSEQSKRIRLVRKYQPVPVIRYCLMHSLLVRFESYARELHSGEFDQALDSYRSELGWFVCALSRVISKTPFAARGLQMLFRINKKLLKVHRKSELSSPELKP